MNTQHRGLRIVDPDGDVLEFWTPNGDPLFPVNVSTGNDEDDPTLRAILSIDDLRGLRDWCDLVLDDQVEANDGD